MRTLDINLQIEAMKHETKAQPTAIYGQAYVTHHRTPSWTRQEIGKSHPGCAFRKTANGIQMTAYNGIIQIEVNHLANLMEVNRVNRKRKSFRRLILLSWVPADIP